MLILDYKDRRPIYEQVVSKLEELMLLGAMKENEPLPSVRSLAMELSINPNTIQRAYVELERQGYKLSTTTSSGGLILALQRAITTARPEGRYRKHCYWLRYKAVLLESSLLESSACSLIYFCTASSVILPIVST